MSATTAVIRTIKVSGQGVNVPTPGRKPIRVNPVFTKATAPLLAAQSIPVPTIQTPLAKAQTVAFSLIQKYAPTDMVPSASLSRQHRIEHGLLEQHATNADLNNILSAAVGPGRLKVLADPMQYRLVNHIIGAMENSAIVKNALAQLSGVRIKTETDMVFNQTVSLQPLKQETNWLHATKITEGGDVAIHADLANPQVHPDPRVFQAAIAAGLVYKATGDDALANRAAMDIAHKQGDVRLGVLPMAYASSDWLNGVDGTRNGWLSYFDSHVHTATTQDRAQMQKENREVDRTYWNNRPATAPAP